METHTQRTMSKYISVTFSNDMAMTKNKIVGLMN